MLCAVAVGGARAQDEAIIEPVAGVLAAEDARRFDAPLFGAAARHPSPIVRRHAALAMGRIGNPAAFQPLLELTSDPDPAVRRDAVFALGLLGDGRALRRLTELALADQGREGDAQLEAVSAATRIGGPDGARIVAEVLSRWAGLVTVGDLPPPVARAARDAWRLGRDAPVALLVQFAESRDVTVRRGAVYSLGRLGAPGASGVLLRGTEDRDPQVRAYAVRALRADYADSAGIARTALASRVERLVTDRDVGVRIQALRALASYGGDEHVSAAADRTADSDPNVRVQALAALGEMEGPAAARALAEQLSGGVWATRRQALLSMARVGGPDSDSAVAAWARSDDWRVRYAAAEALGVMGADGIGGLDVLKGDPDPRVVAEALGHLLRADSAGAEALALAHADHEDVVVRATVFRHLGDRPDTAHLQLLIDGYARAREERHPAARLAVVRALGALASSSPERQRLVDVRFLSRFADNGEYQDRRLAEAVFPDAAARWGPSQPLETGKTIADYRDLARELLLPAERGGSRPAVEIETDRGALRLELLADVAPLTVRAFLDLVDRRYFDGVSWHRVVPDFVVQGGDPRGDGRGSPGFTIRDEVSPLGYDRGTVGMARAGPDTGGSQFFITLGPQPHLEGGYTVFGSVLEGAEILSRITLGDRIRRVRRR